MSNPKLSFIIDQQTRVMRIKERVMRDFYYLESEALSAKPNEKSWSAAECIAHINLVNSHYVRFLSKSVSRSQADADDEKTLKSTWFGRKFAKTMAPKGEAVTNKMGTFKKVNPTAKKKEGYAVVEKVVFQNLMDDLDELATILEKAKTTAVNHIKVKSLAPMLKLRFQDAINLILNHTERHLIQAKNAVS